MKPREQTTIRLPAELKERIQQAGGLQGIPNERFNYVYFVGLCSFIQSSKMNSISLAVERLEICACCLIRSNSSVSIRIVNLV